ncbi:Fic family protein [Candidatus Babeliales bacterium]|nr:Fic family protein [Candidatus Babeliales bacterium]
MKKSERLGTYITQKSIGKEYKAFIPPKLPPLPSLDLSSMYSMIDEAMTAIGKLNSVTKTIPNTALFIYMYVRKEALLSSQIEGTQSSFSELILFENKQKTNVSIEDVEEVSNYISAIQHGIKRLKEGFPLSLRLLREIHAILLRGSRGSKKTPGQFRHSQNWIGGTRPGNALFVPPPPDHMLKCLSELESFLHDKKNKLPILVKAALVHVQFETIHPFLDGNGRLGRLLIILLLCEKSLLEEPTLYISLYLKKHRKNYYRLLQQVRENGDWEAWIEFFLEGIIQMAENAVVSVKKLNDLFVKDLKKIETLGRAQISCAATFDCLKMIPQTTVQVLSKTLKVSEPTARNALSNLLELNIVKEVSGQKKNKTYVYSEYLKILAEGTEPLQS